MSGSDADDRTLFIAADFGGVYGNTGGTSFTFHDFLIGPRATLRGEHFNVFAHALGGFVLVTGAGLAATNFAFSLGGGLDYNLSKNLALRLVQVDYLGVPATSHMLNNIRAQSGLVFRFGN